MNLHTVFQKSWKMLWNYQALWLFGAILALVGVNVIYFGPWINREEDNEWTQIKISDSTTLQVPGPDLTIDLTTPGDVQILTPDAASWREFRDLVDFLNRTASINLWAILIELAVLLVGSLLFGTILRYVAETAVIRMVNDSEETGKRLSVWGGLRRGWSLRAGRLFLLDLMVGVLASLAFLVIFGLAAAPVLLAIGSHESILITAGVVTFGLIVPAILLWLVASALLSLVLQTIRRACALEEQGLLASIRQGIRLTKRHLTEIVPLWMFWIGIQLLWIPFAALALVLLAPLLLLTIPSGVALGGVPTALVAAFSSLFMPGATPWIMGVLAGLPIFLVVIAAPMLFVSGLVKIFNSALWTLAYRDLKTVERMVEAPVSQAPMVPAQGSAD